MRSVSACCCWLSLLLKYSSSPSAQGFILSEQTLLKFTFAADRDRVSVIMPSGDSYNYSKSYPRVQRRAEGVGKKVIMSELFLRYWESMTSEQKDKDCWQSSCRVSTSCSPRCSSKTTSNSPRLRFSLRSYTSINQYSTHLSKEHTQNWQIRTVHTHHSVDNNITMNILTHKLSFALNPLTTSICFMASKMQASSTQKTKDSAGRRLGIKVLGDQEVYPNDIIARQRGFKWKSGKNVIVGLDQTIHARTEGIVKFRISHERKVAYYYVDVQPKTLPNRKHGAPLPYNYHPELFPERAARNHPPVVAVSKCFVKVE